VSPKHGTKSAIDTSMTNIVIRRESHDYLPETIGHLSVRSAVEGVRRETRVTGDVVRVTVGSREILVWAGLVRVAR
jgi:hypothetical protein